ncbi:hypothetical protein [Crateriforma spongiae]|uniref:hypothetical protein n=1 Tax=Crateriforma spongiae TaxID=2724528 RepID=UPI0039AF8BBE
MLDDDTARGLPDGEGDALIKADVLIPAEPANILAACCGGDCSTHEVHRIGRGADARFYEICPYNGMEPVATSRLRQWSINGKAIADLLAFAIASDQHAETLLPGAAWHVGDVPIQNQSFSVVLSTARGVESLAERSNASRMILLGCNLVGEQFAGCLSISDAFDFLPNRIELRLQRLHQVIPTATEPAGNAFYRKGQMWVVRFEGQETFLENNVGLLYIARLLATPNRAVPAITLLASRIGIDERKLTGSSGELADQQSVEECRQRYTELMQEIEEASENNDFGRLEKLQAEQDALTTHFASVLGKGGKRREVGDIKKVSQSVSVGIKRTIEVLDTELRPLADHLRAYLSRGVCPMYSPPNDMHWLT